MSVNHFEEKKHLFRKGVSALIINRNQELLLVNLQSFETKFYVIPGGGIEEGEIQEMQFIGKLLKSWVFLENRSTLLVCVEIPLCLCSKLKNSPETELNTTEWRDFSLNFNSKVLMTR